jgi:hypothetical protein
VARGWWGCQPEGQCGVKKSARGGGKQRARRDIPRRGAFWRCRRRDFRSWDWSHGQRRIFFQGASILLAAEIGSGGLSAPPVGLDTIYKSRGRIPESFLRGCGVPESFITQMRALVNAEDGIQFYSCFISHSTKDAEFATRLHGKMRGAHLRVWYAPEDMPGGKKLHEEIETAIRVFDKLLIVLSEHSLESEWVKTELRKAFKAERESERAGKKKRKLFPVRLTDMERIKEWSCFDADSGKDLGVELREYFIPDFSRWKEHDQFEASFARLLKDLKADERGR